MTKSSLQVRAEDIHRRFIRNTRRTVVIEFSGSPKAGKTTVLSQVQAFLKRIGFKVEVVVERASVCPIRDKRHAHFNIWTACTTLVNLLEKTQEPPKPDDPQILILDRGIFDAICWLRMMENLARLRKDERQIVDRFLSLDEFLSKISGVIVMTASPSDSMSRERGQLPVVDEGGLTLGGSIMNEDVLARFKDTLGEVTVELDAKFDIKAIDTSSARFRGNVASTCEAVASEVLNWIESQAEERILFLPRDAVAAYFDQSVWIDRLQAEALAKAFLETGQYEAREIVEADAAKVQALPIVVITNRLGQVLQLRRRERDIKNSLHEKLVVWAGGHVREDDNANRDALRECAVRELNEELRLHIDKDTLTLRGAIYVANSVENTARHVALVYEWTASTDDVSVVLNTAEFFERTGASLSGKFRSVIELQADSNTISPEPWTKNILEKLLGLSRGQSELSL